MTTYSMKDILPCIDGKFKIVGDPNQILFQSLKPVLAAEPNSLVFIDSEREDKSELIARTRAHAILCDLAIDIQASDLGEKCLIQVNNPRHVFLKIGNRYFIEKLQPGIHPTASIHPEAEIHETVHIGPFTYVGKCSIGAHTILHGHIFLYDGVKIGENVIIHAGTVVGAAGFGYLRSDDGSLINFPHLGGVVIEDDVEIGANTCIDRGSLRDTIIRKGAKIDNLVHIAHNVQVGESAMVIASAMVGGSVSIGKKTWVSPASVIRDQIKIGKNALVGLGAVVTKDIPDGETWVGLPARNLQEFLSREENLKRLLEPKDNL